MISTRLKPSIGIVGGGIGGVAAALALRQVGIDAVVYEKALQLAEVGAGMMLWPNATRVLLGLGLLPAVLARSGSSTHFLVRASSGAMLMNIALGDFEVPAICIRRSDESRIFVAGRRVVTGLLPARLFEHNLRRVYSYEI